MSEPKPPDRSPDTEPQPSGYRLFEAVSKLAQRSQQSGETSLYFTAPEGRDVTITFSPKPELLASVFINDTSKPVRAFSMYDIHVDGSVSKSRFHLTDSLEVASVTGPEPVNAEKVDNVARLLKESQETDRPEYMKAVSELEGALGKLAMEHPRDREYQTAGGRRMVFWVKEDPFLAETHSGFDWLVALTSEGATGSLYPITYFGIETEGTSAGKAEISKAIVTIAQLAVIEAFQSDVLDPNLALWNSMEFDRADQKSIEELTASIRTARPKPLP